MNRSAETKEDSQSETKSDGKSEAQPLPAGSAMEHDGGARPKGMYVEMLII